MMSLLNSLDRKDITKMLLGYKFALEEMNTKISILLEEFEHSQENDKTQFLIRNHQ